VSTEAHRACGSTDESVLSGQSGQPSAGLASEDQTQEEEESHGIRTGDEVTVQ
jgi:hypothetical protein